MQNVETIAPMAYSGRRIARPCYFANDHSRDQLDIVHVPMPITEARNLGCTFDREGFALAPHKSSITDFQNLTDNADRYRAEMIALILEQTGADHVACNAPGVLRFSERASLSGKLDNSLPARFAHVDVSDKTAAEFGQASCPPGKRPSRVAHYNIWRCFSGVPQDVPLAICDARSVAREDLIEADAIFDRPGVPDWSFEGWVVAHNATHRWCWFSDMTRDEVIIFKTNDSDPARAHCVPHVAFDDPDCPSDAPPRASIEMRATAYWFD